MKFLYQNTSLISEEELQQTAATLRDYVSHLNEVAKAGDYEAAECSINLPADKNVLDEVLKLKEQILLKKPKYILVVGIGGSNLGTKAVYDALHGHFDLVEPKRLPKIMFIDTLQPDYLGRLATFLQKLAKQEEDVVINVVSKSGATTEIVANAASLLNLLQEKFPQILKRVVITTDQGSKLWNLAQAKNWTVLQIPAKVGGRFSSFSAVSLFPLLAAKVKIKDWRKGALSMRKQCLSKKMEDNPALLTAAILYLQAKQGRRIYDSFFFRPELESLGKYFRQLWAESLGKNQEAITPIVSVGTTDLHSVGELYLGGPRDKFTSFISVENVAHDLRIPQDSPISNLVSGVSGRTLGEITQAVLQGVMRAYQNKQLPFVQIVLEDLSERSLGEIMQYAMMTVMYLGKLMGVNAFNQPNVESYKEETRKILNP